jgi:hypothetical protein
VELKRLKVVNFDSLLRGLSQGIFVQHTPIQCGELCGVPICLQVFDMLTFVFFILYENTD